MTRGRPSHLRIKCRGTGCRRPASCCIGWAQAEWPEPQTPDAPPEADVRSQGPADPVFAEGPAPFPVPTLGGRGGGALGSPCEDTICHRGAPASELVASHGPASDTAPRGVRWPHVDLVSPGRAPDRPGARRPRREQTASASSSCGTEAPPCLPTPFPTPFPTPSPPRRAGLSLHPGRCMIFTLGLLAESRAGVLHTHFTHRSES